MVKNKPLLSITIPIYNEEKILVNSFNKLRKFLVKEKITYEILLVENGSSDRSKEITNLLFRKYPHVKAYHLPDPCYGKALKCGFNNSRGKYLANISADWIDLDFLKESIKLLKKYDVIMASKSLKKSKDERNMIRKYGSRLFHKIVRMMYGIPFRDTHGIKVMKREKVQYIIAQCSNEVEIFDIELIIRCFYQGIKILEYPVILKEIRPSRIKVASKAVEAVVHLIKLKYRLTKK